jgi:DNA-binding transcriptional ArsR family regulator
LLVGLALWHIKGLRGADTFTVSNLIVRDWGIQPDAKRRALRALEKAGLITIERQGKRSPLVTLVMSYSDQRVLVTAPVTPAVPTDSSKS